MPEPSPIFVAFLATGPSPEDDSVVEVAAVRDGARAFHALASCGGLSRAAAALTGLSDADLAGKPATAAVLCELLDFTKGSQPIVYDADALAGFFHAEGLAPPLGLDARELAMIVLPAAHDFSLNAVADALGIEHDASARAGDVAMLLAHVWPALLNRFATLPVPALDAICRVAHTAMHPMATTLQQAAATRTTFALADKSAGGLADMFAPQWDLFSQAQKQEPPDPTDKPIPSERIARMFAPGGAVAARLPDFEHRPEQVQMVRGVCAALNDAHHLMVEAGTGTGKSMAYLLPMIAWAVTNSEKVLISTNTRNLQDQLFHKDMPFLSDLMPDRFNAALLKGRSNYLCVRRFLRAVEHSDYEFHDPDELAALLPLIAWAAETTSGDQSECNGFFAHSCAPAIARRMVTTGDECSGRACRQRGRCFVHRARALAQLADVIVVNHAVVFAELGLDSRVLPPHRCMVFDEAHNLEHVATEALARVVDGRRVRRITNFLHRNAADGRGGTGLFASTMYELRTNLKGAPPGAADPIMTHLGMAMTDVEEVVTTAMQFLDTLREPFFDRPPWQERIRLDECDPPIDKTSESADAAKRLRNVVVAVGRRIEDICELLDKLTDHLPAAVELTSDMRAQSALLREICDDADFILTREKNSFVYWLQRTTRERGAFYSIHAAPLEIGSLMRTFFYDEKRSIILTSATMQVDGDFQYMCERLGAETLTDEELHVQEVGSPFDYERQALIGVTSFLPDPGGRRDATYDSELASFLIDLLTKTRGRGLVLFTSYSLLQSVYEVVRDPLQRAGIMVLAQGHSGGREAITAMFRSEHASVLLGTRSFWEGVDVAGETLSCLVLTKLPFHVFTDPLVRGRTDYLRANGRDPFTHYTLPEAVINFRQGFGRLIRRCTDRGIIVVTDKRLVTKGYGSAFLSSTPGRHEVWRERSEALKAVGEFFAE